MQVVFENLLPVCVKRTWLGTVGKRGRTNCPVFEVSAYFNAGATSFVLYRPRIVEGEVQIPRINICAFGEGSERYPWRGGYLFE